MSQRASSQMRSVACRLCAWLRARLWEESDAWERAQSNEHAPWSDDPVQTLELVYQAADVQKTDSAAAFRLYLEAAEAGSAWAMNAVAGHYWVGTGVAADFEKAQEYYCRAMAAGSWMAAIHYARLLAAHGYHDDCEELLERCVAKGYLPACYWLALLRYQRSPDPKICLEIKPLLERAAIAGHPDALFMVGQLTARGKFGLRNVPAVFKWGLRWLSRKAAGAADLGDLGAAAAVRTPA